ncbi:phospholipid phosphatase [Vibrio sp. UCD-FRSSP16_10]|uniref:phosphatase PAP2 family protein n=1 Tax=unclassified Vibrio TaxID=2614977 RepID=UPI0007FBB64C|nr:MULTISPECIES: phosphatase PAP2 family protein [unclassified Vibrio]OBT08006.1 phospholipid phosphatase [Vibrio sp. UCD-FRSSP16_30]OBT17181.1 phospholipid phosphatase [Vibrio sp. UCD-FRSSP16_10]
MQLQYWKNNICGLFILGGFLLVVALASTLIPAIDLLGSESGFVGGFLTYLTYSAGSKGFLITLGVLVIFTTLKTTSKKQWLLLMVQLGVLLVFSFAAKTMLKEVTQSPRPYTHALTDLKLIESPQAFYALDESSQNEIIEQASNSVSAWRIVHWQGETDYSFPSGHTVFVALCVFFFGGLFCKRKQYGALSLLLIWGLGVAYSRLWLGMHRPEDLIGSALVVAVLALLIPSVNTSKSHH